MGHASNLNLSYNKRGIREKRAHFPILTERWREERKTRAKVFLPRSTKFCWSVFVGLRTKVHRIDEGYVWVPRKKDFVEDPRREISGDQSCLV